MAFQPKPTDLMLEREDEGMVGESSFSDAELLDLFKECKKESFDNRWIWERGWMRNIHYVNNRQWIEYIRRSNEWRDVRLAKWFPKPVTNKIAEGVQALRAMFASVNIGVNVRPSGEDPKNVAVAAVADAYGPVLHEEHDMDNVMNEADFWFIVTGNVFGHTFLERDAKHGFDVIPFEQCVACKAIYSSDAIAEAGQVCPDCGANQFQPAMSPETGLPMEKRIPKGKGVTIALSPFELAFPTTYARFEDVPYVVRMRWRSKDYYTNHPVLKEQVASFNWSKAPSETSLQLFRSLPFHNDMGVAPFLGAASGSEELGAPEYEVTFRPCDKYPEGLVFRVLGDGNPIVLHLEESEAIPGPLPYVDAEGKPLFTYYHAGFEQRGGRVYCTSPLDGAIQKQNQLNQLDAFILMIIHRMSNPLWLVPKGAEIEKFTGEPGLVVKWNPLTVGGNAKPERVDGGGPNASLFQVRDGYLKDIEESLGTYDIIKGSKPSGVEAFSAMQLLVERSQSRFASAFKARGNFYKDWFKCALEIEREFGPERRQHSVLGPANSWVQQTFDNAQLQGSFSVIVEDGSQTPKTTLGIRAAVEHLNQLGFIDPSDPDQKYKVFQLFGQTRLSPSLDIHMQAALRKQQAFEEWAANPEEVAKSVMLMQEDVSQYQQQLAAIPPPVSPEPQQSTSLQVSGANGDVKQTQQPMPAEPQQDPAAMLPQPPSMTARTPLAWKPWFNAPIHKQEFLKWANSDRMVQLLAKTPGLEPILTAHLAEIDAALAAEMALMAPAPAQKGGGAGRSMANSNNESTKGVQPGQKGAAQDGTA